MQPLFSLENQIAIVTGGGSGIGLKTVQRFIAAGAKVVMADMNDCSALAEQEGALFVSCDVTDEAQVAQLIETTISAYGKLDILVNNAGIFSRYEKITDTSSAAYQTCYNVNLMGVVNGIKYAAPVMQIGGRIVNTASAAGLMGALDLGSYVASKHAVVGLTKTAAIELGERQIRINCVCPTTVNTPMAHQDGGEFMLEGEKLLVPLERICEPEDVAALIHFLSSNDCSFISGQAIMIDGGMACGMTEKAFAKLIL
jgi:NAD(P)-dependent dehydrogenase (short-subunit alcohol dehydrogenase family)